MSEGLQAAAAEPSRDVRPRIRALIAQLFYVATPLADDASLLDSGIIDSTAVLEVIASLETEFGIRVSDDEVVPQHFDSIAAIAAFVQRKRAAR